MPWVRIRGYSFGFGAAEPANEPAHVHVAGQKGSAKIWLGPVRLATSHYSEAKTREILGIAHENEQTLIAKWRAQFRDR